MIVTDMEYIAKVTTADHDSADDANGCNYYDFTRPAVI